MIFSNLFIFSFLHLFYYFLYLSVLPTYMHVYCKDAWCPWRSEGMDPLGLVTDGVNHQGVLEIEPESSTRVPSTLNC